MNLVKSGSNVDNTSKAGGGEICPTDFISSKSIGHMQNCTVLLLKCVVVGIVDIVVTELRLPHRKGSDDSILKWT